MMLYEDTKKRSPALSGTGTLTEITGRRVPGFIECYPVLSTLLNTANTGAKLHVQEIASWLLLPPSGPLLLALGGLFFSRFLAGRLVLLGGLLLLYAFSLPMVSYALMGGLQEGYWPPAHTGRFGDAQVIVVLGAGYRSGADEYSGETVNDLALTRLRYAARLHRQTGLPVVVTGGGPEDRVPEAHWMAEVLAEYGVAPVIREERARDTWGNAFYSEAVLSRLGYRRIVLVTHAHHMRRAEWAFRQVGLEVIPAPTAAFVPGDRSLSFGSLRPQASALYASWLAMHEYLGMFWYRLQHAD